MKKLMMIFGAIIFASFIFTSCGSKSKKIEDIKIDEITNICDCVEAHIIIMEELIEIYDGMKDIKELNETQKAKLKTINKIAEELRVVCTEIEGGEAGCEDYDKMMSLRVTYNQIAPRSKVVKAKDIKAEDMENLCDCVDASLVFTNEMIAVYESVKDVSKLKEEHKEELNKLNKKWEKVSKACEEIAEKEEEEVEDCENFEKLTKAQEKLKAFTKGK